jgi:hypothetical protein
MNHQMTASEFEQRHLDETGQRSDEDSPYEKAKYEATLEACGSGPFVSALELGGSIGVFTELLAPRCKKLTTIDVARTAEDLERTLAVLRARLIPGGRLVAVHWHSTGLEHPFTGGEAHARLRDDPWLRSIRGERAPGYLLDVLERR